MLRQIETSKVVMTGATMSMLPVPATSRATEIPKSRVMVAQGRSLGQLHQQRALASRILFDWPDLHY